MPKTNKSGIEKLREAVNLFNNTSESTIDCYTPEQLLKIADAYARSGWDITPDRWSGKQLYEAATFGTPPDFQDDERTPKYARAEGRKVFRIPVQWSRCATVEVDADSLEAALEYAASDLPIPSGGEYLDDSFVAFKEGAEEV